jgi:hypothetical protein
MMHNRLIEKVQCTMVVTRTFSDGRMDGRSDDARGGICDLDAL